MAGGAFDPAEFAAFKGASAPSADGFDPAEFAAFKAPAVAPEGDRAMEALSPFFQKGVSTRNSAGQWTGEARALLTKAGVNPDTIDQKAERGLLAKWDAAQRPAADSSAYAHNLSVVDSVPVFGPLVTGGMNKAAAFTRSIVRGMPYSDALRQIEAETAGTMRDHPVASAVGGVIGGVAGTAPLVAAAPAAFGAGTAGLAARSLASGASGALLGGADAAVRSGDDEGAKTGVLIGGGLGAVAPGAGALIGKGVNAAAGAIAARRTPVPGVSNRAAGMLADDLKTSGGIEPVQARLAELGPESMLLDASPTFQGRAQGLAVQPETRQSIVDPLRSRNVATNDRLSTDLAEALGPAENPIALRQAINDTGAAVSKPSFQRYDASPAMRGVAMDELASRPIIAKALRDAEAIASNEGNPLARVTLDEAGRVVPDNAADAFASGSRGRIDGALGTLLGTKGALAQADEIVARRAAEASPLYEAARAAFIPDEAIPTDLLLRLKRAGALGQAQQKMAIDGQPFDLGRIQSWDYMKRALDDRIGAAKRAGKNDDARIFTGLKSEVLDAVDGAVPVYAEARQAFAGHSDLMDALEEGRNIFAPGATREEVKAAFKALTPGEQEMYRLGAGNALREKLANTRDGNGLPHAVFGNAALREKLAVIAPSTEAASAFTKAIAGEQRAFTEAALPTAQAWRNAHDIIAEQASRLGDTPQGRAAAQAASDLRAALSKNSDFASGVAKTDEYAALNNAIDRGVTALNGDRGALHPRELEAYLSSATPEERAALRAGTRGELDRIVGTQANDLVALRRQVLQDGDWNRAKLEQIFGPEEARKVFNSVDRESAFREAYNKIVENSQTAQRSQAAASVAPREIRPGASDAGLTISGVVGGVTGGATAGAVRAGKTLLNALGRGSDIARNREAASILTMRAGPERDALIEALNARLEAARRGEATASAMDDFVRRVLQSQNDRSERPERAAISAR